MYILNLDGHNASKTQFQFNQFISEYKIPYTFDTVKYIIHITNHLKIRN